VEISGAGSNRAESLSSQWIAENPGASRRRLYEKLCEAWPVKQANGALRDMVCGLLLMRTEAGEIDSAHTFRHLNLCPAATPAPMSTTWTPIAGALNNSSPSNCNR